MASGSLAVTDNANTYNQRLDTAKLSFCSPSNYALDQRLGAIKRRDSPVVGLRESIVNTIAVLESILILAPTALEMGLTPVELLHVDSRDSLQEEIADLMAARDANERYSAIKIMSSSDLKSLVGTFAQSGKPCNMIFNLIFLLNSENSQTIYLWHDKI